MFKFKKSEPESTKHLSTNDSTEVRMPEQERPMLKEEKVQLQPSVISEGAEIEGNLNYPGSVQVYGKFKGNIKAETVNIGESGLFNGLLVVDSLIVYGKVLGEVKCNKLILNKTGSVSAKVKYSHIEIQSGAIITGDLLRKVE